VRAFVVDWIAFFAFSVVLVYFAGLNFVETTLACALLGVVASIWGKAFRKDS
jgi:hypothetical protein